MEKIGQSSLVLATIDKCNSNEFLVKRTNQYNIYKSNISNLAIVVKNIDESKDIQGIVNCERILIENDLDKLTLDKINDGTSTSLQSASADLERSYKMIAYVKDVKGYRSYESSVSLQVKDRISGLPRDAFHRFIDSNVTRLNNGIVSPKTSNEDKDILLERKSNMKIAKDEYMKLQAVALDIELPEKNKERDRER